MKKLARHELEQITLPKFNHCEKEPKTGDFVHDNRQFIYCPEYLSLMEIIPMDDYIIQYPSEMTHKTFFYFSDRYQETEELLFVFIQNNLQMVNASKDIEFIQKGIKPISEIELMDQAFEYYKNYLMWEDQQ